jgi:hypothetical protein
MGTRDYFLRQKDHAMKMTTHFHVVLTFRVGGSLSPCPQQFAFTGRCVATGVTIIQRRELNKIFTARGLPEPGFLYWFSLYIWRLRREVR